MQTFLKSTMLIERLLGVLAYFLLLLFFYLVIKRTRNRKTMFRCLNVYLIALCVLAFFYVPSDSADLYRWFNMTENWPSQDFRIFFREVVMTANDPIAILYVYLCRLTRIDGMLPMFACFVFYLNFFSILKNISKDFNVSNSNIAILLFFFMSMGRFVEVISGVRCLVAVSIFSRCLYLELVRKERTFFFNCVLYFFELVSCLIHPYVVVLFCMKSLLMLFIKERNAKIKYLNIVTIFLIVIFGIAYGKTYFNSAIDKGESYLSGDHYSYGWEYLIASLMLLTIGYSLYVCHSKNLAVKGVKKMCSLFLLIALLFCFQYSIFHRTITFLAILSLSIVAMNLQTSNKQNYKKCILVMSTIILLLASTRGDLCGYKFFQI